MACTPRSARDASLSITATDDRDRKEMLQVCSEAAQR
jgi:hypothetical protein